MITAQIILSAVESERLRALSRRTGKSQDELLREAVRQLLKQSTHGSRLERLRQARGIWQHRDDLTEFREFRNELDRF